MIIEASVRRKIHRPQNQRQDDERKRDVGNQREKINIAHKAFAVETVLRVRQMIDDVTDEKHSAKSE